jgi:hypothetical protein
MLSHQLHNRAVAEKMLKVVSHAETGSTYDYELSFLNI